MSVVLNGSTQYLHYSPGGGGLVAYPFTVSIWFNPDNVTATFTAAAVQAVGYDDKNIGQCRGSVAGDYLAAATYEDGGAGWALAYTTAGYSASAWQHMMVVFNSPTDRRVYLSGANKGTDATDRDGGSHTLNQFQVGARDGTTAPTGFFDGMLAEFSVYNKALSDANAVSLASGVNPQTIEADNLIQYNTLLEDGTATVGENLTPVGSPSFDGEDHPSIGNIVNVSCTADAVSTASMEFLRLILMSATADATSTAALNLSRQNIANILEVTARLIAIGNDQLWYEDV